MDQQRIPLQEEADGRIGILEGPEHRLIRRLHIPAVSLPIIDGSGHIAQGGEIPAPLDQRRIAFVSIPESTPGKGHEQRAGDLAAILRAAQQAPSWKNQQTARSYAVVTPETLEQRLNEQEYMAVFLTSPDYLGCRADLRAAADICRRHQVPLLVDNAHGAYLKFLSPDEHPLALGADACCDSAHKTLSCLTGAAYLHLAKNAPENWKETR